MRKLSLILFVLFAAVSSGALVGCNATDNPHESGNGTVKLSLVSTTPGGTIYHLGGTFDIYSDTGVLVKSLSSDDPPLATSLTTTLPGGSYNVLLEYGWQLDRVDPGTGIILPVPSASLISPNPQEVAIATNQSSSVAFQFLVNGNIVQFGDGQLNITSKVIETDASATALSVGANDYTTAGSWTGYGYTFLFNQLNGDSITPTCSIGTGCTPAMTAPLCASGTLVADSNSTSGAGVGFNLNQAAGDADSGVSAVGTVSVTGNGLIVDFSNAGGSDVRVEVTDFTDPNCSSCHYWCYDLKHATSPVYIPWSSFNTACWDNSGTAFDKASPITQIALIVPSSTFDFNYNVCLNGVGVF